MNTLEILFYALSAFAIVSAIMVLVSKNPIHSVLWLILVFFAISGHYILLNAQFLAVVNLIVYAGAIMVLFLFVIMLMNLNTETEPQKNKWLKFAGTIAPRVADENGAAQRKQLMQLLPVEDDVENIIVFKSA